MSDYSTGKFKGLSKSQLPTVKANNLNDDEWQVAGVPLGDGNFWIYQDRNARIEFGMDEVEIDINRFSRSHDNVQIFDNPKHLFLAKSGFEPGSNGLLGFTCNMKSKILFRQKMTIAMKCRFQSLKTAIAILLWQMMSKIHKTSCCRKKSCFRPKEGLEAGCTWHTLY